MLSNVKKAYQGMKTARLFKKYNVRTWTEYHLKFDPHFNLQATSIKRMFHGYLYIAEIVDASALLTNTCDNWEDSYDYLRKWLATECKGKARAIIDRAHRVEHLYSDGTKLVDWEINTFSSDSVFVAFQDERDYLIFLLKWRTA